MAYHSRLSLEQVASRRVRENKPIGNNIAFRDSVHKTSKEFSRTHNIQLPTSRRSGGLISLMNKCILKRDKGLYSIHYKLIPYIRKKANLDYGAATRGTYTN